MIARVFAACHSSDSIPGHFIMIESTSFFSGNAEILLPVS
jgi:hypothetical protein